MAQHADWTGERRGIDRRHPDSSLVNLEEIGHKLVEVDIRFGEVEVGQLLPVAVRGSVKHERRKNLQDKTYNWNSASKISMFKP